MAAIDITKNHTIGKAAARTKAEEIIQRMGKDLGMQGTWNGDVYAITKPTEGRLTVSDTAVRVEVELGFAMRVMKGKIEEKINAELNRALT